MIMMMTPFCKLKRFACDHQPALLCAFSVMPLSNVCKAAIACSAVVTIEDWLQHIRLWLFSSFAAKLMLGG